MPNKMRPIRILIVDDHGLLREGLAHALRTFPDLQVIGEAATGSDAVRLCQELRPDLVLMDPMLRELDGVAAIRQIHQQCPEIRLIAMSNFGPDRLVQSALRAGAASHLPKHTPPMGLATAIRAAFPGAQPA